MEKLLPDICRIQYGFAFDSAKFSDSVGTPLIRIRDVVRGYSETYTTEQCGDEYVVQDGDMLIGMDGEFNIAHWKGGKAYLNQRVCRLIPTDKINSLYLFYFMPQALKAIEDKTPFVTVKHLSAKELNKVSVPIPSMAEQEKIATSLQKVDELISLRKQQLQKLDELVKARFVELFGDLVFGDKIKTNRHKIGEIASVTKLAGFEFTKYIQYKEQGEIIMLRGLNCKKGKLVLDDVKWIDKDTSDLLPRSKLFYGDILMTYAGTIGDVAMVDADNKYHLAPNVAKITLNDKDAYNPVFLMHLFMYSNDYIMTFASQVAQASINMEKIRSFEYYFHCIDMQNEFATFVKQTDKTKLTIRKRLDKLELLKSALMQKYFG